jgi:DNA-binding NtrC family response regulator
MGTVNTVLPQIIAHEFRSVALAVLTETGMGKIGNKFVLIIDDDVGMLRALNKVLSGEGCMVASAASAEVAVKFLTNGQQRFDLIITDLRMPAIDGMGILRGVKQVYPEVPVIIITAFGSAEVKAQSMREGAAAFLEKPMDVPQLLATIDRVLAPSTP